MPPIEPIPQRRRSRMRTAPRTAPPDTRAARERAKDAASTALALGLLGSLIAFLAQPPLDLWPLAWIAPIPWLWLCRQQELIGRRPYGALWVAGFAYWLAAIHWLRLPHWSTHFGWLALSMYLGCYLPVFVGLTRQAVHRLRMPLFIAAPIAWVGLELTQAHLLGGFTMGFLGNTQYHWVRLIQVSDLAGGYAVSFVIVLTAGCLTTMLPGDNRGFVFWPVLPAAAVITATLLYGGYRLGQEETTPALRVAIIQGSMDSSFAPDPDRPKKMFEHYRSLSQTAVDKFGRFHLMLWPESCFPFPVPILRETSQLDPAWKTTKEDVRDTEQILHKLLADMTLQWHCDMLVGTEVKDIGIRQIDGYNAALFVEQFAPVSADRRYDKMHLVMFGEYIPLADRFPWLYDLTPLTGSAARGTGYRSFTVEGVKLAPSICYETVIPHLIRRCVSELRERDEEPDVLVNLTNDGWFWGSSELDQHLACAVFRAVECRKPILIAANTGISAHIDGSGRVLQQAPKRETDVLLAEVELDNRDSIYVRIGDIPAGLCLLGCGVFAFAGYQHRRRQRIDLAS